MSSQVLLTPQVITRESLVILENNLVAASRVNRRFENKFVKIGATLTIRKPNRFTVASGASLQLQDIAEPSVSITVNKQRHVDFQFTSQDLSLTVEEFNSRYLKPAMAPLANQVDFDVLGHWIDVSNYVGTPTVTPATFSSSVQLIGRRQDDNACQQDGRTLVVNPAGHWALAGGLIGSFVMPTAKEALVKGYLSTIGNYEIYMDQNIQTGNSGQHNTSIGMVVTSAGNGTGTTTSMFGGTATETLSVGEVFTVAGVFNVNPQSRQSTGVLKNFVVTASTTPTSSTWTVNFTPAIVTSGPYQNVSGPMSTASGVTWLTGTTTAQIAGVQNLAFVRDAFGLVMVPLEIPGGVDFAARETYRNISMRTIRAYDINNDVFPTRIDILYGDATYYDELACRLGG
jgi:hypothetical protein